ncbi:hypothetical protein BDQ17DRAFT_1411541 [Cyathus striatus]|nr:hypothetical protein BDQ17DRAFT_1411541 [Cyathus striatus]
MFIPFLASPKTNKKSHVRRKGGGGGGHGSGGHASGHGSGHGMGRGGMTGGHGMGGMSVGGWGMGSYGGGSRKISAGMPFEGRTVGGGTREGYTGQKLMVVDTRESQDVASQVVIFHIGSGQSFGLPLVWQAAHIYIIRLRSSNYTYPVRPTREYNAPRWTTHSRTFTSSPNSTNHSTYHLLADSDTTVWLFSDIAGNCSSLISSPYSPTACTSSNMSDQMRPEQVVQYYRASSVALTLDGYNNSATFSEEETVDSPLPQGYDSNLLECLNRTIGSSAIMVVMVQGVRLMVELGDGLGDGLLWVLLSGGFWVFGKESVRQTFFALLR